jgi:vitamin B12 transporter
MRTQRLALTVALLVCSAVAVCPGGAVGQTATPDPVGQTATPPVFESVVVGTPIVSDLATEDRAASASVITQDRTPRASESVTQLLSEQSGATVTRLGGMGSTATLSLRGSTSNQVLVYVDRVPFNSATGGGVDLGAIPLGDVSRIEIYRGMSPIGFGASAIGGVVSITTEIPKQNRVDMDAGGGSFGTYYGGAKAAYNRGRFHAYAGVHLLGSDGDFEYLDNQRTTLSSSTTDDALVRRRNNDLQQTDGSLRTVADLSPDRHLGASFVFFDREQGLPGPIIQSNPTARLTSTRSTAILSYQSNSDLGRGGSLRATAYGNRVRSHLWDPAGDLGIKNVDTDDRTVTGGLTLDWSKLARDWLSLSGVLDTRVDRFRPSDSAASGAPATRYFGAAGLAGDLWIEPWRLDVIASARIETAREETSGRDKFGALLPTSQPVSHTLPIGRLSIVKGLGHSLSLRANGGRYARLPSTIELYGNTGYLLGNPGLRPESGVNLDLGPQLDWKRGQTHLLWSAAGFASFVDDLIRLRPAGGPVHMENLGKARILGVESEVTVELGTVFRGFASATFTDARDESASESAHGQPLPFRPRYRLYARPEVRNLPIGRHVRLGAYADIDATAGNYVSENGTAKVAPRLLFGAGLFADLPLHFSVRISARNLGNARINDLMNYPLPGRELYLTLLWSSHNNLNKELQP